MPFGRDSGMIRGAPGNSTFSILYSMYGVYLSVPDGKPGE
jgi:hypothetical protein